MITALKLIRSEETLPYPNIALEAFLTDDVRDGECLLYLWQNRRTVVIGKNQNAFRECRVERLESENGYLARRLSGGGAVYHDLGNLNFSFIARRPDYDVARQTEVILTAVRRLGVDACRTGRNDITVDGRKFSGNAFFRTAAGGCCHHGTLMMDVDGSRLADFLSVPEDKLRSKGVASVRSRVANLREYCPDLTRQRLEDALTAAFAEVYGLPVHPFETDRLDRGRIAERAAFLASEEWLYGRPIPFTAVMERRFAWGGVRLELAVNEGVVKDAACWSDAMDAEQIAHLRALLPGRRYRSEELRQAARAAFADTADRAADLCRMIEEEMTGEVIT